MHVLTFGGDFNIWSRTLTPLPSSLSLALNLSSGKEQFYTYTQTQLWTVFQNVPPVSRNARTSRGGEVAVIIYFWKLVSVDAYVNTDQVDILKYLIGHLPALQGRDQVCWVCCGVMSYVFNPFPSRSLPSVPWESEGRTLNSYSPCLCHLSSPGWPYIVIFGVHLHNCTGASRPHWVLESYTVKGLWRGTIYTQGSSEGLTNCPRPHSILVR